MFGINKELWKRLGKAAVTLIPQFLEKTPSKRSPSVIVVQTRKTSTNTKTRKNVKGDSN